MIEQSPSCFDCVNSNCLIKKYCPPEIIEEVISNKGIKNVKNQHLIFQEDNDSSLIYFIYSGIVKVYKNGAFNKDQIVRFSLNGDILGHRGLNSSNVYPVSSEALSNSKICYFSKDYFFTLLEKAPLLSINLMLFFSNELNQEENRLRDMAIFNVREKVAKTLILLIDKFGLNTNNCINFIEILSRQDIADISGLTPNQITKVLSEFKQDKFIETEGKKIKILSKDKIENIVSFLG